MVSRWKLNIFEVIYKFEKMFVLCKCVFIIEMKLVIFFFLLILKCLILEIENFGL